MVAIVVHCSECCWNFLDGLRYQWEHCGIRQPKAIVCLQLSQQEILLIYGMCPHELLSPLLLT